MKLNQENIGFVLIAFSIILIAILSFVKVGFDRQGALLCEAVEADPNLDMEECPAHKNNTSWLILVAFGMVFFILVSGIYLIFMPVKADKHKFKEVNVSKLDKDEKTIYNLLKRNDGSMYQSDLIKETGLSKVKISRILDKLTSKDIIDRKRRGMTNIIVLK